MSASSALQPSLPAEARASVGTNEDYTLNVVLVHEEAPDAQRAAAICDRLSQLVGREVIRIKAWKISELAEPETLADAALVTAGADMIIVSVRAADPLPPDLCAWIEAWLPHRPQLTGALVALIGLTEQSGSPSDRARQYLEAVARKGGLDFLLEERHLAAAPPALSPDLIMQGIPSSDFTPDSDLYEAPNGHELRDWGINE